MGECGVDLVEGDVGERDRPGVVEVGLNGGGVLREKGVWWMRGKRRDMVGVRGRYWIGGGGR